MTIIRNDRNAAARRNAEAAKAAPEEEPEVDYTWRPTPEDYDPQITVDQWAAMLADSSVFDEDGLRATQELRDYGVPATFQQLSVRYGATMGRYRRWLEDTAKRVGEHLGKEPPQRDQFGNPEWWPLMYQQRPAGKVGAHRFEMLLRPELVEALDKRVSAAEAEKERAKKEAEEAAAKARAEASKKAIQERIAAAQARQQAQLAQAEAERAERQAREEAVRAAAQQEAARREAQASAPQPQQADAGQQGGFSDDAVPARQRAAEQARPRAAHDAGEFASVAAFLQAAEDDDSAVAAFDLVSKGSSRKKGAGAARKRAADGSRLPLDYAKTYAERIYEALDLIAEGEPGVTPAAVARLAGGSSVEALQGCLNGQSVPSFDQLDRLCEALFLNPRRLEATDAERAKALPVFSTLRERCGAAQAAAYLQGRRPKHVYFVVDDSEDRRTGVILGYSELAYVLLERVPVNADADRTKDPTLKAFVRMVRDIDAASKRSDLQKSSLTISSSEWDALAAGNVWPGTVVARHA
jgi:chemotaxis protein histidine kinase CheA